MVRHFQLKVLKGMSIVPGDLFVASGFAFKVLDMVRVSVEDETIAVEVRATPFPHASHEMVEHYATKGVHVIGYLDQVQV